MPNNSPTLVVTGRTRLSYEHLVKPYANKPGEEEKFSVTLLIPKTDIVTKQKIDAAINAAITAGVSGKWKGVRPPQIAIPLHDGDGVRRNGEAFGDECKGCWVMTASSKTRPEVVDLGLNPILSATEIYSGMFARASINFFAYDTSGNRGIGCGLNNIQKLEDGEPLAGRTSAADDFGGASDYSAAPAYQPPMAPPVYPPQYTPQPAYPQQYAPQPAYPPQYAPQPPYGYPQATPAQPATYQPPIDPITGKPSTGGVMGL